jgi:hypothetical protein
MIIACGILMFVGIVSTLSLCKAAGRADRWSEELYREEDNS